MEFDTASGGGNFMGGTAIFVMDRYGRIYAWNNPAAGEFHHSSLAHGGPVAAAGELAVRGGRIEYVTSASGHYKPQPVHMLNFKHELERQGIYGVPFYDYAKTGISGPGHTPHLFTTAPNSQPYTTGQ